MSASHREPNQYFQVNVSSRGRQPSGSCNVCPCAFYPLRWPELFLSPPLQHSPKREVQEEEERRSGQSRLIRCTSHYSHPPQEDLELSNMLEALKWTGLSLKDLKEPCDDRHTHTQAWNLTEALVITGLKEFWHGQPRDSNTFAPQQLESSQLTRLGDLDRDLEITLKLYPFGY